MLRRQMAGWPGRNLRRSGFPATLCEPEPLTLEGISGQGHPGEAPATGSSLPIDAHTLSIDIRNSRQQPLPFAAHTALAYGGNASIGSYSIGFCEREQLRLRS